MAATLDHRVSRAHTRPPVSDLFTSAELSHVAATWLAGGTVTSAKLIPSFWHGEFGRAWITREGVTQPSQQLITTAGPCILDVACLVTALVVLRPTFSRSPFVVGIVFMLLCLRPGFDFVCESVGLITGDRGDFRAIHAIIGASPTQLITAFTLAFSLFSVLIILMRYAGFPGSPTVNSGT